MSNFDFFPPTCDVPFSASYVSLLALVFCLLLYVYLVAQAAGGTGSVPVTQLTVEQLGHVRQTTEREIEMLMTKIGELNVAHQKLTASRECATFMGESSTPQPVLVPLTTSIYVPGVIQNPSELMVDVGTGYFISVRPLGARRWGFGPLFDFRLRFVCIVRCAGYGPSCSRGTSIWLRLHSDHGAFFFWG